MRLLIICLTAFAVSGSSLLWGSQVLRKVDPSGEKTYVEDNAEFELAIKVDGLPQTVEDAVGRKIAQVFQFSVENRNGVRLPATKLQEGDLLLEPLMLVGKGAGEDGAVQVEMFPGGHTMMAEDLYYIHAKSYRVLYDAAGGQIFSKNFQVGDVLDVYRMSYTEDNELEFIESGFQSTAGEVIIENGTTLEERHIAMLNYYTPNPVRVRHPVDLELEFYLRADWPDAFSPDKRQFWIKREGEDQPMLLYSYQIKEGDRPLLNISNKDLPRICEANVPLTKEGRNNSLEAIDRYTDAVMLSKKGNPIVSVDPITKDPSDRPAEPGELVIAPRNEGEYLRPYLVESEDDINSMLLDGKLSFARGYGNTDKNFPFKAYLTHYIIPFPKKCMQGCDDSFEISSDVMAGKKTCATCLRENNFRPYVYGEVQSYPYVDKVFRQHPIHCAFCGFEYSYATAHALCGDENDMVEYPKMALNAIHPSRLRRMRLPEGAELTRNVTFYQNGREVVIEEGTPVEENLRYALESRSTSPVYVDEPRGLTYDAAQCPRCFGWNSLPGNSERIRGPFGVDEVRRVIAAFPVMEGRINRLDLVVFGLDQEKEPVSARSRARVVTFRRYGDEHFKDISRWKKTEERWAFLPRYAHEEGYSLPLPLQEQQEESDDGMDFFGDDVF